MEFNLKRQEILETPNIAELLTETELNRLGDLVVEEYELDEGTRESWLKQMEEASTLALQIKEEKSYPWPKAANVKFPSLTIACLQFHARAYPALITENLVKGKVYGADPEGLKRGRADRISSWLNYQIMDRDAYWEDEQDALLMVLPLMGSMFKKTYYDGTINSEAILPKYLVADYYAKTCESAMRLTHVLEMSPVEVRERQLDERFLDIELEPPRQEPKEEDGRTGKTTAEDKDASRIVLEQHRYLDLDNDNYPEPYVVTADKDSRKVLRIVPRFTKEHITYDRQSELDALETQINQIRLDERLGFEQKSALIEAAESQSEKIIKDSAIIKIEPIHFFTRYLFLPHPDGGFYGLGFGALLGPINETINTSINQLLDAGSMQNLQSGFIGRGARIKAGTHNFSPGEWKTVNAPGGDLRSNIVPLPLNEPSAVLYNLLTLMIEYSQRLSSVTDMMQGVTPGQNTPMTTAMASLEQGMKVFSGILKRIYRCMTDEISKLYIYQRTYVDIQEYMEFHDNDKARDDFGMDPKDIKPSADPNASSDEQKMMRAQVLTERAAITPGYNPVAIERKFLAAIGIPDVAEIYDPEKFKPQEDPELLIKQQDADRKDAETKARIDKTYGELEIQYIKLESEIGEREARIQKAIAESAQIIDEIEISSYEAVTNRMKVRLETLQTKLDEERNDQARRDGMAGSAAN